MTGTGEGAVRRLRRRFVLLRRAIVARLGRMSGLEVVPAGEYHLVRKHFYSPIPDAAALDAGVLDRRSELAGISLDLDAQVRFVERDLVPFVRELSAARADGAARWHPDNGLYEAGDGDLTYAMVRAERPQRIVELGSGWSTLVLAAAVEANRRDGVAATFETYDPFPSPEVVGGVEGLAALHRTRAQDVPRDAFTTLEEGDVLFVDTTHTVKTGSDVNAIVLDRLPLLRRGVRVHFHDIFLPYEYHREWVEDGPWWNEQYLLQAFLSMNPSYEVVLSTYALLRDRRDALAAAVPHLSGHRPSSFWIKRVCP